MNYRLLLVVLTLASCLGCSNGDDDNATSDPFQTSMLNNWADNIIIPRYQTYFDELADLQLAKNDFLSEASSQHLFDLRRAFRNAYIDWQSVAMFQVGPSEEIDLVAFSNSFPADVASIEANVMAGNTDLTQEQSQNSQGFPALDYLLYGVAGDDATILTRLSEPTYQDYLAALVDRLYDLTDQVLTDWNEGYSDEFTGNANSTVTMINKMGNAFLNNLESQVLSMKLGRPGGSVGQPRPESAEAIYVGDLSQQLILQSLSSASAFFRGQAGNGSGVNASFSQYLDQSQVFRNNAQLSIFINNQFSVVSTSIQRFNPDVKTQVEADASVVLDAYDDLLTLVRLIRDDMFRGLGLEGD